ncbi:hypothetical protein ACLB0R_10095 [Sphingomonas sp. GlSt437]|uniref:hypothetical protein n=1 Tax=Sphingomonas sp. GlSt437 TaxID=3389970 RepID=UPI003A8A2EED
MTRLMIALLLATAPAAAIAQDQPAPADAPVIEHHGDTIHASQPDDNRPVTASTKRIRSVLLQAGQACPPAKGDEIVVCGALDEPYRIPKDLRQSEPTAANRSWATRAEVVDDVGRRAAGLPGTCSTVGSGGQTGCTRALLEQWTAETLARKNGQPVP